MSKEVKDFRGDWKYKNPTPVTSGWAFEFNNKFYPDVDDTFKVLLALSAIKMPDEAAKEEVMQRALNWAVSFQCKCGGFAAFDKDVTKKWLQDVPFADHNAILDPPCSDITSRALEVFGRMGVSMKEPFVQRAIKFVRDTQLPDGSWEGRWGVNYIYGTWLVLRGLRAVGVDMNQDWILRGLNWLESCQNADGGWGESPATYDNPRLKGQGESTPSQTAWALMGIIAASNQMRPEHSRRRRISRRDAERGRLVDRGSHHGHRLPESFLSEVRHVPEQLAAAGAGRFPAPGGTRPAMICYAFPVAHEAELLLAKCTQRESFSIGPVACTLGNLGARQMVIAQVGMGQARARESIQTVFRYFRPKAVVLAGYGGALVPQLKLGQIIVSTISPPRNYCRSCACSPASISPLSAPLTKSPARRKSATGTRRA